MVVKRLDGIPGFSIDKVAKAAGDDPYVLRLENLDTDLLPPSGITEITLSALTNDDSNSYLPFTGNARLCQAVATHMNKLSGRQYNPEKEIVITCGGTEWEKRRNTILEELHDFPLISASGGWSMLLNVGELGYDSFTASKLLLEKGKIAATPMRDWGQLNSDQFVRFVFSNEPVHRLKGIRERVLHALPKKQL